MNIQEPLLDSNDVKSDLVREVIKITHLNSEEKEKLLTILKHKQGAIQDTKGTWTGKPIKLELKKDSKPFYGRPCKIPQPYRKAVKTEVDRLIKIGLLTRFTETEWAAPSFLIPKKDDTVRFLTDF